MSKRVEQKMNIVIDSLRQFGIQQILLISNRWNLHHSEQLIAEQTKSGFQCASIGYRYRYKLTKSKSNEIDKIEQD